MSLFKLIDFTLLGDERGSLVALEGNKNIPFDIKRVYYIFGTKHDIARGFHAHKKLKQVMICINGKCKILLNDGERSAEIYLDSPCKGLVIEEMIWREMHDFSTDCILLVLASEFYNENDYIRNYEEFIQKVSE
jgi:dTDP-4-dehydrorhamnose 3,5-epimerase-like enzyme